MASCSFLSTTATSSFPLTLLQYRCTIPRNHFFGLASQLYMSLISYNCHRIIDASFVGKIRCISFATLINLDPFLLYKKKCYVNSTITMTYHPHLLLHQNFQLSLSPNLPQTLVCPKLFGFLAHRCHLVPSLISLH